MKLGFTGTRHGMTWQQKHSFVTLASDLAPTEFAHGDCVGADDEAANMVHEFIARPMIHRSPGPDGKNRAWNQHVDVDYPEKSFFARNRDIVDWCDCLIACPREMGPQDKGGTWYTVGYGKKKGKRVIIVWPDGRIEETNGVGQ